MSHADRYSRGVHLYHQGRYVEAEQVLSSAAGEGGLIGRLGRYYQGLASHQVGLALARRGRWPVAQDYLQRAIGLIGRQADLGGYLARVCVQAGRPERAEAKLEAATGPDSPPALKGQLALTQMRAGRREQAMLTLTEALRTHGDSASLHLQMGLALSRADRFPEAGGHFRRAIECDCACADAHYYLALCEAAEGRCAEAVRHMERAYALRPHDLMLTYQMATIARAAAEGGRPVQLSLRSASTPPGQTHLQELADFVTRENDFLTAFLSLPPSEADEALFGLLSAVLTTALARHEGYADLHYQQSLLLVRLGRAEQAVRHAERALAINPDFVAARIQLGRLLADTDPPAAVGHLRRALSGGGDYADVHMMLGRLYHHLGRDADARRELRRALQINPNYTQADEAIGQLAA